MFCRIYFNGNNVQKQFLLFQLCDLLEEKLKDNFYIENDFFSIDVSKNDEFHEQKSNEFPDGFLYFPLSIEIDIHFDDEVKASAMVDKILKFLWSNDYSAVASCDFEELLIEKGGYKSRNIPWRAE